jgi:hypothetical protein
MDFSSDSFSENDYLSNNFNSENKNQFNQQFPIAFNIVFPVNTTQDDYLLAETLGQNINESHTNIFTPIPGKPTSIISEENNFSEIDNKLFNKPTEVYKNLDKYSKDSLFKNISGQRKRVDMHDNMRKRIKSDYSRNLLKYLNELMIVKNSENPNLKFCFLPQCMVSNMAKDYNKKVMEMTLKEMILDKSFELFSKKKEKDEKIWEKNKNVINYIENKLDKDLIKILNMKMKDLYLEYLNSDEFANSIKELKEEGKYFDYIKNYIQVAKDYVEYYS